MALKPERIFAHEPVMRTIAWDDEGMGGTDAVFLNGTVGVGKSAVAEALAELEERGGTSHAVIDLDYIRRFWPAPGGDPFNLALELANLEAVVANYRAAGAERLILAGVIERRGDVARYAAATRAARLVVVRLTANRRSVDERLRGRHAGDPAGLAWHLARAGELAGILDAAGVDDISVDTSGLTPAEVAGEVRRVAGWQ
ncbi:hypothetical protein [Nocardia sp. NPDC006630]|uniref:AAA family ATPase n=1 Tax=Nocardia sp. NPDC006630 TaxID=3157181 RepID=UPI0033A5AA27